MVAKRKRRASPSNKGLAAGEQLKRNKLACNDYSAWGWVDTEVKDISGITTEHILATCGFSKAKTFSSCPNIYKPPPDPAPVAPLKKTASLNGAQLDEDVVIISDDEPPPCNKKICKNNPNCLNYLGQDKWEDEDDARELFLSGLKLGENPILNARDPNLPVGLRNLGATCYANAFLQVWFRDLAFRNGVYQCQENAHHFEKSPIFQLQVTFAALQESTQSVFNPTNLVESLQLRTTEQQDAQEFSKLFMSHLDAEFQKQSDPSLQSLIDHQFQGKQVYGTICENPSCHNRSERVTDFLEIEINFENNSTLEDRITALLQPETLSGDNMYLCPRCESLQNATRYTEFRQLPPVLHFSLLRFVYDFASMERKKSKHSISFPLTLDMGRFLHTASTNAEGASGIPDDSNIYELRGVLLHKGTSAYHGHYEAQVFDTTNQSWFQFNDETVTKIGPSCGQRQTSKTIINVDNDDDKPSGSQGRKQRANARKKRRVDDSDDEMVGITSSPGNSSKESVSNHPIRVSSKDAYMLIYSRKGTTPGDSHSPHIPLEIPNPPARAWDVVRELNAAHDEACEKYQIREKELERRFEETRQIVRDIYRSWNPSPNEKSIVVSRQSLEDWMLKQSILPAIATMEHNDVAVQPSQDPTNPQDSPIETNGQTGPCYQRLIDIGHILCDHGHLDPRKANDMKRISETACRRIAKETHCNFRRTYTTEKICKICVNDIFTERLYHIQHPRSVSQFDQLCEDDPDGPSYWISKQWLRDWRLVKPKMHVISQGDLPPDAPEFNHHVRCEHGGLSLNSTARRRISEKACGLLMDLYPSWEPLRSDTELCPVCDALIHISKEDKREVRKMAEEEKARLKHMHDNALNGNTFLLENVPCAVLPAEFVRSWLRWLMRPTEIARPDVIDNSPFICSHDLLLFDPNDQTDLDETIAIVTRSDWDVLEDLYSGGPLIALEKCYTDNTLKYVHEVPVCIECRHERKLDYEFTDITVRIVGTSDSLPGPVVPPDAPSNSRQAAILTNGSQSSGGIRQSKRLQRRAGGARRKVTVSKSTTVKEIKIMLQDELNIATICQRLFYRGQELEDNETTMNSLGLLANDVLDLRETEITGSMDSDSEDTGRKQREEERGFGGTLLAQLPNAPAPTTATVEEERHCSVCTFCNPPNASICSMCETPFA